MLKQNNLDSIENIKFSLLETLRDLNLEENKITEIREYSFSVSKRLVKVFLARNKIKLIDQNSFKDSLDNLEELWLNQNEIEQIHPLAFEKLPSLKIKKKTFF